MTEYWMTPYATPYAAGHTCVGCGFWVTPGLAHTCFRNPPNIVSFVPMIDPALLERLVVALEAIQARLETAAGL